MLLITLQPIPYNDCRVCQALCRKGGGFSLCRAHTTINEQQTLIKKFVRKLITENPCSICHGVQKTCCMICGWRLMTEKELNAFDSEHLRRFPHTTKEFTNRQMARIELDKWMKFLKGNTVGKVSMRTTGDPVVDEKIKAYYELWSLNMRPR